MSDKTYSLPTDCFLCDKIVTSEDDVSAWNDEGSIFCAACGKREQEEWDWITGEGAA